MKKILIAIMLLSNLSFGQSKLLQANKLMEENNYPESKRILQTIKESENDYAQAQFSLGKISFFQKDYDSAEEYFEAAIEKNDKVADFHNWLGNTYGMVAQESNVLTQGYLAPKMKAEWELAIALDKNNLEPRWALVQYYTMAPSFMGGSFEKAREMAAQIKKINVAEGHRANATIFLKEKNNTEAEKELKAMVKADPTFKGGLANFYLNQKQYNSAFRVFEEMLIDEPENYAVMYQLAKACAISGENLGRGIECLKKYMEYNPKSNEPSHAGAQMRLGQLYEKSENRVEAKKFYQASIKADPSMTEAKEGLDRLGK